MRDNILFKTNNQNSYLFNLQKKQLSHIKSEHYVILERYFNEKKHIDFENFVNKNYSDLPSIIVNNINELIKIETVSDAMQTIISEDIARYYISNYPQIAFEVTEKCNLDCKYCTYGGFYEGHDPRKNKDLSIASAKKLIKYILESCSSSLSNAAHNIITISFYGGEPLLRPDFVKELVGYAKSIETKLVSFNFGMTSNATLLTKNIDFLVKYNFNLLISLDGNEENHSYRVYKNGKNSYNDVIKNIKQVQKEYPEYFKNNISINSVLHNKNSVKEISSFIKNNFNKEPMIAEISTDGLIPKKKEELLKLFKNKHEDLKQSEDYYHSFQETNLTEVPDFNEALYFVYNLTNLVYSNHTELFLGKTKIIKPTGTCLPFSRKIFVTATGRLLPCENIAHEYAFGFVDTDGVNIDFKAIATNYNDYLSKMTNLCSQCYRKANCSQCMYYLNIDDENVKCYGFMNKKSFSKYLKNIVTYLEDNPSIFEKIIKETSLS